MHNSANGPKKSQLSEATDISPYLLRSGTLLFSDNMSTFGHLLGLSVYVITEALLIYASNCISNKSTFIYRT